MTLQIGQEIGQYQITEQIGAGGMATVFKASQPRLGRDVAIKVMHPTFTQETNFTTRFEREARIVARLDHPNIVPVYDYDTVQGQPFLVMKIVEGQTLKDVLKQRQLTQTEIITILGAIADALTYAHEQGILHRDVKPSNILLDKRGIPYLTDFGLARITSAGESTMSMESMLGTPHYISPEQAQGGVELDARTDVYSLGVVLYELVTGTVPFKADSSYAIINSHITASPPLPSQINPTVTQQVEAVILKALSKRREDRYDTPNQLMDAFRQAAAVGQNTPAALQQTPVTNKVDQNMEDLSQQLEQSNKDLNINIQLGSHKIEVQTGSKEAEKEDKDDDGDIYGNPKYSHLSIEERIRLQAEKRVKKRTEEFQGIIIHTIVYIGINSWLFGLGDWVGQLLNGNITFPPIVSFFWGLGLISHFMDYYMKYGPGREREEKAIQREIEREREKLYGSSINLEKPKNDLAEPRLRLTDEGEFTESFIEEQDHYQNRRK